MQRLTENVIVLGNKYFNHSIIGNQKAVLVECGVTASVCTATHQTSPGELKLTLWGRRKP